VAAPITRTKAYLSIVIDGKDVTSAFDKYLISATVTDYDGAIDMAEIVLDDAHGVLEMPADNTPVSVNMGWQGQGMNLVFTGKVTDVGFRMQKRSGRELTITANGADMFQLGKQPVSQEWGEGKPAEGDAKKIPLGTVLGDAAKKAGYSFRGAADICALERDYWAQTNESFHSFAKRLADEVGGVFKIQGEVASLTSAQNNTNAAGKTMPMVTAATGEGGNVLACDIHPKVARSVFAETSAQFFDDKEGKWKAVRQAVGGQGAAAVSKAIHTGLMPVATEDEAKQVASALATGSLRAAGYGWILIDGAPEAAAGGQVTVKGARAGVDGVYKITEATHTISKRQGFTTRLTVAQPGPTVGKDFRGDFER
jgi:phage protein D